jgi:hypothetical protein
VQRLRSFVASPRVTPLAYLQQKVVETTEFRAVICNHFPWRGKTFSLFGSSLQRAKQLQNWRS